MPTDPCRRTRATTFPVRSPTSRRGCTCRRPRGGGPTGPATSSRGQPHRHPARPARAQRRLRGRRSRTACATAPLAPHERPRRDGRRRRAGDEAGGVVRRAPAHGRRRGRGSRCSATWASVDPDVRGVAGPPCTAPTTSTASAGSMVDAVPDAVLRLPPTGRRPCSPSSARQLRHAPRPRAAVPHRTHDPGPVLARPHGLAPHRRRPHRAVQLALRPPPRRHVRAPHRGHRRRAVTRGVGRRHPGHAAVARASTGTRAPYLPVAPLRRATSRRPRSSSPRVTRTSASAPRTRSRRATTPRRRPAGRPRVRRPLPRSQPRRARRARGGGRPRTIRFRTPDDGVSTFTDLIRGEVQRRVVARSPTS